MSEIASTPLTLYPANIAFVRGQTAKPAVLSRALPPREAQNLAKGLIVGLAGLFMIGLIAIDMFQGGQLIKSSPRPDALLSEWWGYTLGGVGLILLGVFFARKPAATLLAYRRLRRDGGHIIIGQILGVQPRKWLTHGAGGGFIISYCFASPTGKQIKRTETIISKAASPIPESALGAAISVLYHSDRAFTLL